MRVQSVNASAKDKRTTHQLGIKAHVEQSAWWLTLCPQPLQNGPGNGAGLGERFRTLDQDPQGFAE